MLRKWGIAITAVLAVQIILGGIMSGMKAGLIYPTWPLIDGGLFPSVLFDSSNWTWQNFENYDNHPFMPALIQILHRSVAYILTVFGIWYFLKMVRQYEKGVFNFALWFWIGALTLQVILGILTLINCKGVIPVGLGVMHQAGAVILLSSILLLKFLARKEA